jgi:hypothetical protein
MPKAKKTTFHFNYVVLAILAGFLLVGGYFYKSMQQGLSINKIETGEMRGEFREGGDEGKNKGRECGKIVSLSYSKSCGDQSYESANYICGVDQPAPGTKGMSAATKGEITGSCQSYTTLYKMAMAKCSAACPQQTMPPKGGDRDKYGCTPSAGYSWCPSQNKCVRPGETPCKDLLTETGIKPTGSSAPSSYCAQIAGQCISKAGTSAATCVSYTDSCQRAKLCDLPVQSCNKIIKK